MELLFLYIKNYHNILTEQQFNFSNNFQVSYSDGNLNIEKKENLLEDYYGKNISNITLFLGKNGVGKTTILDILGMDRRDRVQDLSITKYDFNDAKYRKKYLAEYFLVYHIEQNKFLIEFSKVLSTDGKCIINNIEFNNWVNAKGFNRDCESIIVEMKGKSEFTFLYEKSKANGLNMEYCYMLSYPKNARILSKSQYKQENDENDYMLKRTYFFEEASNFCLYNYYKELLPFIIVNNVVDYEMQISNRDVRLFAIKYQGMEAILQDLIEKLECYSRRDNIIKNNLFGGQKDIKNKKEYFLSLFCCNAILYYFFEIIIFWKWGENEVQRVLDDACAVNRLNESIDRIRNDIGESVVESYRVDNIEEEYAVFYLIIHKIMENKKDDKIACYKEILRYVINRYETIAKEQNTDISDKEAIFNFLQCLEDIDKKYFVLDNDDDISIKISCRDQITDKKLENIIKKYDCYIKKGNIFQDHNRLIEFIEIKHPILSEGYQAFVSILAKVNDILSRGDVRDNIVLLFDEPDRSLHPELARNFIKYLVEVINKHNKKNVQIVLTSHSPFIVTDILPESVYSLQRSESGIVSVETNRKTYATNIYMLLMDSFMISNTFGEYSYKKINALIEELLKKEEKSKEDSNCIDWEQKMKIQKAIIDRIGENVLKNKLLKLYESKYEPDFLKAKQYIINQIDQLNGEVDKKKLDIIKRVLDL